MEGFAEESGNYVKSVSFSADGSNKRVTDDGADLELFMSVSTDAEYGTNQGQQIIMAAQKSLEFSCKYSLEDQTISSTTNTVGSDITINRASRGNLVYTLTADESSVVGQKKNFSIVPANPGVVHSLVESCEILNDDETRQYGLTELRGSDTCTDWLTAFAIESGPWCSDQQQDFSFTSFKWDSSQDSESQKIRCKIQLKTEHDASYNPGICSVTTTTTTTTTTTPLSQRHCASLYEDEDYTSNNGFEIEATHGDYVTWPEFKSYSDKVSSIIAAPGCKLQFWEHKDSGGSTHICDASSGSITSFGRVCDLSKTWGLGIGGNNIADTYECTCSLTEFAQSDFLIYRPEETPMGFTNKPLGEYHAEYWGLTPRNFEVSFEWKYETDDLLAYNDNGQRWKTIMSGNHNTAGGAGVGWWWGISPDVDFRYHRGVNSGTIATPTDENWPEGGLWHKARVVRSSDFGFRLYHNDELVDWAVEGNDASWYDDITNIRWGPAMGGKPPMNQLIRNFDFKEYFPPASEYCGSIYENADLTGWSIDMDKYGEGAYDLDIYSQGMGDQMSAIKVVPGCRITTYNDNNFNGNHGQFTCDNTDGNEDKVCDDIGATNNNGDSFQCHCGKFPQP